MGKKRVCVIMVNYNNSQLSIDCYNSLVSQKELVELTVVVSDNNSKVEEKKLLENFQNEHLDFEVVYNPENLGYFSGMVRGQEYAYNKGEYDYMIVANNDLIYDPNFIKNLISLEVLDDVMVISPDIERMDGVHQNPHFVNRPSKLRNFLYYIYFSNWYVSCCIAKIQSFFNAQRRQKDKPGYKEEQYIYMGFGACFILTELFMKKIKFLDCSSFLMGEEQLLTIQVAEANGKIYYQPSLKVHHLDSATFRTFPSRFAYENMRKAFKIYQGKLGKCYFIDNQFVIKGGKSCGI
jgi:probable rhamnosyl transferase